MNSRSPWRSAWRRTRSTSVQRSIVGSGIGSVPPTVKLAAGGDDRRRLDTGRDLTEPRRPLWSRLVRRPQALAQAVDESNLGAGRARRVVANDRRALPSVHLRVPEDRRDRL